VKKKLLITLGCSVTEGQGCWGGTIKSRPSLAQMSNLSSNDLKRFRKFGWPNRVGKKLGFDKVINLARGGGSNSGQIKLLYEREYSDWDVYVIWMMTDSSRFSFYINKTIKDYVPNFIHNSLSKGYVEEIVDIEADTVLESLFYVDVLRNLCKVRGYNLLITYWNKETKNVQGLDTNSENYLYKSPKELFPPIKSDLISPCMHPSENGHEWIANEMVREIKERHKHFIQGDSKENIEWEWDGYHKSRIKSKPNFII